jgi:hypothetical protein
MSEKQWDVHWGSIHEAAHAVVARYFFVQVKFATLHSVHIRHRRARTPDDDDSMIYLIVSAAGNAATDCFYYWTNGAGDDVDLSRQHLRELGADEGQIDLLMQTARKAAYALVPTLEDKIFAVAAALRDKRILTQTDIDALLCSGTSTITYSVTGSGAATLAEIQVTINGKTLTMNPSDCAALMLLATNLNSKA